MSPSRPHGLLPPPGAGAKPVPGPPSALPLAAFDYFTQNGGGRTAACSLKLAAGDQELMLRSWRRDGRTIALGAGLGVLVLVLVAAAAALLGAGPGARPPRDPFVSVVEVMRGSFFTRPFNGTWHSGSRFMYLDEDNMPVLYDAASSAGLALVANASLLDGLRVLRFEVSADAKFLLVMHSLAPMSEIEYTARYELLDRTSQSLRPLEGPGGPRLQRVLWAPVGSSLALVQDNDVFYCASAADPRPVRLSASGRPGLVYNGLPSWSYEAEILVSRPALWFSPDGGRLVFGSFNDSAVGEVAIPQYGQGGELYPAPLLLRYPKPGAELPRVALHLVDLRAAARVGLGLEQGQAQALPLPPPEQLQTGAVVLGGVVWASASEVTAVWSNRVQDTLKVAAYDARNGTLTDLVYSWEQRTAWADLDLRLRFSADGARALLLEPSPRDDFPHVLLLRRLRDRTLHTFLSRGPLAALSIAAWDERAGLVFFLGTGRGDPAQQHLYSVPDGVAGAPHSPRCLTCGLRLPHSPPCLHAAAAFAPDGRHYLLTCAGPGVPELGLFARPDGDQLPHRLVELWEDNAEVRARVATKVLPATHTAWLSLAGGRRALVRLWLPPNYDISKAKYPLLVDVNGWPAARRAARISDEFRVDWRAHLAANRSVVYAVIEASGARLLGDRARFATHRRFGTVEVEDQVQAVRELIERYNYIDEARVGIWGWSYGGYLAIMALARGGPLRCGIAVAPIVNWRHYNALFTERYLHLPEEEDNAAGYERADAARHVKGLRGKRLLLAHGTLDTTVHFAHSLLLARALQEADVPFEFHVFTDEEHALHGSRAKMYGRMEQFLEECFPLD